MPTVLTAKDQIIDMLRDEGYDYWTAAEHATAALRAFLASGEPELTLHSRRHSFTLRKPATSTTEPNP